MEKIWLIYVSNVCSITWIEDIIARPVKLFFLLVAHPKILHLDSFLSPVYKDVCVDSSALSDSVQDKFYNTMAPQYKYLPMIFLF